MSASKRAAAAVLIAAGAAEAVRSSGWRASLRIRVESAAPPGAIAPLVRAVEREPEFVPGVQHVRVFARGERQPVVPRGAGVAAEEGRVDLLNPDAKFHDGWVRYEVKGSRFGLPWAVRFQKVWDGDTHFHWWSEGGTGWPEHDGSLTLTEHAGGTRLELWAETRSGLPLLGGLGTLLVNPLFLAPTFRGWLENLARADVEGTGFRTVIADPPG